MKLSINEIIVLSACNDSNLKNIDFVINNFTKMSLVEIKIILSKLVKKGFVEVTKLNGENWYFFTDKVKNVGLNDDIKYFNEVGLVKNAVVKRYCEKDYARLKKLINTYYAEMKEPLKAKFYSKKKLDDLIVLYAEYDNKIVGFILSEEFNKNIILLDIFVLSDFRRARIASLLMNDLLLRITGLYGKVLSYPNLKSLGLFKKFNFKELDKKDKNIPPLGKPPFYSYVLIN